MSRPDKESFRKSIGVLRGHTEEQAVDRLLEACKEVERPWLGSKDGELPRWQDSSSPLILTHDRLKQTFYGLFSSQ